MTAPRVSVVLPVRDAAATLPECLRSLAEQSLLDFEVLAVDDGSRDGSRALLESAAAADRRFRVLDGSRRGLVPALNQALGAAGAPLIARMDADDVADPRRLSLQVERLEADPGTEILGCRVRLLRDEAQPENQGMGAYVDWLNRLLDHDAIVADLWVESPFVHPSVVLRASVLRGLGGYRDFDGPEDYDLWLRAHAAGVRFGKVDEELLAWRDRPGRLTRTDSRYAATRFRALKIERLERGLLAGRRPVVIWGAGPIGKGWARALAARGHAVAAFVEVDARKIGCVIHGAPVLDLRGAAGLRGPLHLAAVGRPGAREEIRRLVRDLGLVEGRDFVAVA